MLHLKNYPIEADVGKLFPVCAAKEYPAHVILEVSKECLKFKIFVIGTLEKSCKYKKKCFIGYITKLHVI